MNRLFEYAIILADRSAIVTRPELALAESRDDVVRRALASLPSTTAASEVEVVVRPF